MNRPNEMIHWNELYFYLVACYWKSYNVLKLLSLTKNVSSVTTALVTPLSIHF